MTKNRNVRVLVGAQWGDEGKGKWIDALTLEADLVVRYQGGNNAGHTLIVDGIKIVLHLLPSGVLHKNRKGALAAGVVINPTKILEEFDHVKEKFAHVDVTPENLWISGRAHVITPWHIALDTKAESAAQTPIGTTKRGIGPTYSDKTARTGLRMGEFVEEEYRMQWVQRMRETAHGFAEFYEKNQDQWTEFHNSATRLTPYVCDAEQRIRESVKNGESVLIEGAQGALLDIDHGTYPFVTSSPTTVGGACQSIGLPPQHITDSVGIAKAYLTRVGTGPFPTELGDDWGKWMQEKGFEFGATTGRPRRCGWMDAVALRYAVDINGLNAVIMNKIDILTGMPEIKLCVAYKHPTLGELKNMPWDSKVLNECEPVYKTFKGWKTDVPKSGTFDDLPEEIKIYIKAIEEEIGCEIRMMGTGPGRCEAVYRK